MTQLQDNFGRTINYLRLSVTDRCDFRCVYCMADTMHFVPRQQLLTLEEMAQIAEAFVSLGVKKIRITGGEPLIRHNIMQLFTTVGALNGLDELTLSSNGSQLQHYAQQLADAGVQRINISLDSLQAARFKALSRTGNLAQVLEGIDAAQRAGLGIKLNAVILKQRNADEVVDLVDFAVAQKIDISFIEEMPLGIINEHQRRQEFMSSATLKTLITQKYSLHPQVLNKATAGPSRYWQIPHTQTRVGFISPHSQNFCSDCNRVRVTATGRLLLCLGNEDGVDLRATLRQYPNDRRLLKQRIIDAITIKPERHYFAVDDTPHILRFMNTTGG